MAKEQEVKKGTEEVFEGGPTRNKVENWKQKFNSDVYMVEFEEQAFIFRSLSRVEYKNILNVEGNSSEWSNEERVCETCILWPENYGHNELVNDKAGIASRLSEFIMEKSGFVPTSDAIKL